MRVDRSKPRRARRAACCRAAVLGALLALVPLGAPAEAASCAGISFPDTAAIGGRTLVLNGLGLREATVFNVDVYVGALYLEARSGDAGAILDSGGAWHLVLEFVRAVGVGDITEAWIEGFEKNAGGAIGDLRARLDQLNGWMADVAEGERLVFTYRPGAGVAVEAGSKRRGVIPGADFGRAMLAVWLGPAPPNPGLKTGLLGGACG